MWCTLLYFLCLLTTVYADALPSVSSSSSFSTSSTPTSTSSAPTATATGNNHNITLTDASTQILYGMANICNSRSCPATATINPWIATWGQDNVTTNYFTYHSTNQALARESGGVPYLSFTFNGSAIYMYAIASQSSMGVFNISTNGGATYAIVTQTVTSMALTSNHLVWYATGLDPTIQSTLIVRFWANAGGATALNGVDANGASLNVQSFVITQPGGSNPNGLVSSSSTSLSSKASSAAPSSSSTNNDPNAAIYAASTRTAMILGLAIGIPLFFILLVMCCFLCLCLRRRRKNDRSGSDSEKVQRSLSSYLAGGPTRNGISSRHRGGNGVSASVAAGRRRAPATAMSSDDSLNGNGGGGGGALDMRSAAAMPVTGAVRKAHRDADDDDDEEEESPKKELSTDGLFSNYPGYNSRAVNTSATAISTTGKPAQGSQRASSDRKRTIGPLLVPREGLMASGSGVEVPFVLGLGESKKGLQERQTLAEKDERPQSVESYAGGSSGEDGEEEEENTHDDKGGAVTGAGADASAGTAKAVRERERGYDSQALASESGSAPGVSGAAGGGGRGNRLSMAAALGAGLATLPPSSPPHSLARRLPTTSMSSVGAGVGGSVARGFLNAIETYRPARSSESHSRPSNPSAPASESTKALSPRVDNNTPRMAASSSTAQQASGSGAGVAGSSSRRHKEGEIGLESPESPAALFEPSSNDLFDTFGHNRSFHDRHSPMPSTPELMPKVPLEERTGPVAGSSAGGGGGVVNTGRARTGLGLGLVSPAETVDHSHTRPAV
ncbi:hypothetical protein FRB95_013061 [Tulasnella sp. JGI-2019a]|nr:hypothetical protein FRB95_013061 [Tulasnella sp. JGI-2019a]